MSQTTTRAAPGTSIVGPPALVCRGDVGEPGDERVEVLEGHRATEA
jgi:hypothetical protein